jgi:hypothetical protein
MRTTAERLRRIERLAFELERIERDLRVNRSTLSLLLPVGALLGVWPCLWALRWPRIPAAVAHAGVMVWFVVALTLGVCKLQELLLRSRRGRVIARLTRDA